MSNTPRTDALLATLDFPWSHSTELVARHAEQLERELSARKQEPESVTDAIRFIEDLDELLPIGHDCNIGMAMAIQTLYEYRDQLRKEAMRAAVSKRDDAASSPTPTESK